MSASTSVAKARPGKYLTVALGPESYGISVLKVREIIRLQKITPVPQVPDYVRGVINLRGRVIPIVDLRIRFNLPAESADRTCIVVVQIILGGEQATQMGIIVDRVEDVASLSAEDITPTPEFGSHVRTEYLLGLAKVKGSVTALLDIDRVVATDALTLVAAT